MRARRGLAILAVMAATGCMALTPALAAAPERNAMWKSLSDALFPHETLVQDGTIIKVGTPANRRECRGRSRHLAHELYRPGSSGE